MNTPFDPSILRAGDLLLFSRSGLFDFIIKVKTFSQITHTEIYLGEGKTVASRNGKGCAVYPEDLSGLYMVLRPQQSFDLQKAMVEFYKTMNGRPYGWLSLLSFCLIDVHDKGFFCSETSTLLFRAGGFECFKPWIRADRAAPADFSYVPEVVLKTIWSKF